MNHQKQEKQFILIKDNNEIKDGNSWFWRNGSCSL